MNWKTGMKLILAFCVLFITISATSPYTSAASVTEDTRTFLLDYGNGTTEWLTSSSEPTVSGRVVKTMLDNGHTVDLSSPDILVDGEGEVTIGLAYSGGMMEVGGTTGVTVTTSWHIYSWDESDKKWVVTTDLTGLASKYMALGFYPNGVRPTETPEYKSAWTMIGADSANSYNQSATISDAAGANNFQDFPTEGPCGVDSAILYAKGYAFVKYGTSGGMGVTFSRVVCYDTRDWSERWVFDYPTEMLETTTGLVVDDYIYIQSTNGHIYRINYQEGPGPLNSNVTSFNGEAWDTATKIPNNTTHMYLPGSDETADAEQLMSEFGSAILAVPSLDANEVANYFLGHSTIGDWSLTSLVGSDSTKIAQDVTDLRGITTQRFVNISKYNLTDGAHKYDSLHNGIESKQGTPAGSGTWSEFIASPGTGITFYAQKVQTDAGLLLVFVMKYTDTANDKCLIIESYSDSLLGSSYGYGAGALVYDSGTIFTKCINGMVYAFDMDLKLIWSYQTGGKNYFLPPTICDQKLFAGTYDGKLYVLDYKNGDYITSEQVCQKTEKTPGSVNTPAVFKESDHYLIFVTYSDDGGGSSFYGYGIYTLNGTAFTKIVNTQVPAGLSNMLTHYRLESDPAVVISKSDTLGVLKSDGSYREITSFFKGDYVIHVAPTFVNNETFFVSTYQMGTAGLSNAQSVYSFDLDGKLTGKFTPSALEYAMSPVVVVDGLILCGNDAGMYAMGHIDDYAETVDDSVPLWESLLAILIVILVAVAAFWAILRYGLGWAPAFGCLRIHILTYFFGEQYLHNTRSKRKLRLVLLIGILLTFSLAILSLCVGSNNTIGVGEALSATISSIQKGGQHLTKTELLIYNQRLPRAIATICVGIGLSVAGAVYQAVIKNPLVEPYIMGVSSGAGTFAIAVIIYGFTFFGLFSPQNPFLIATAAIVGGLLAFALTMILAIKTGGKSVNYILSGIIIGLVFSAAQSIMMIGNGTKSSNALSWLYGSFISIGWDTIWLIVFPCLLLSFIPLVWAKELNLVLLGEDQAMQMGLDAKKFDMIMLIVVSILTAFCVAFCGIIGFVGLVIPHLSRLLLGGDHRLMLPASMAFGGSLLLLADLLSRVLIVGYELPVSAITTIIGVPVFAYLLVKRGRSYND